MVNVMLWLLGFAEPKLSACLPDAQTRLGRVKKCKLSIFSGSPLPGRVSSNSDRLLWDFNSVLFTLAEQGSGNNLDTQGTGHLLALFLFARSG